jgi:uncharacterized protein
VTFDPARWRDSPAYARAVELFNSGRFFEAHEEWEELWLACGRRGSAADLLKGLIKLAAAGVKAQRGEVRASRSLARGAARAFVACGLSSGGGFELERLLRLANDVAAGTSELDQPLEPR